MGEKVLVVAVHPDDETLGAGGTLLKHIKAGDEVHWLICTEVKQDNGFSAEKVAERNAEIEMAAKLYGFAGVHRIDLDTMRVDEYSVSDLVGRISKVVSTVEPGVLYLPFKNDVHSDHRRIFEAVYACSKSFRYPFVKRIYMMETLSETEFAVSTKEDSFIPNVFSDISGYLEKKIEIMALFESEIAEHPFPRSVDNIRALALYRGATAGCRYAESFMLLKEIR